MRRQREVLQAVCYQRSEMSGWSSKSRNVVLSALFPFYTIHVRNSSPYAIMLENMSSTVLLGVCACEVLFVKCLRPYQRLLLQTNLVKSSSRRGYYETIYQSLLRYLSPRAAHDKKTKLAFNSHCNVRSVSSRYKAVMCSLDSSGNLKFLPLTSIL